MSNHDHASGHDAHAAPEHSVLKKTANLVFLLVVPVLTVGALVAVVKASDNAAPSSMTEQAITARIQKVGQLQLGVARTTPRTGEEVYTAQCSACHAAGMLGAPKKGDSGAWAPRIATGVQALLTSALKGKGSMTAQGGGAFSDDEVARAVVFMANAGGAKFAEPKAAAEK